MPETEPAPTTASLTATEAQMYAAIDDMTRLLKRDLEKAEQLRDDVRALLRPRVPYGEAVDAGGVEIERTQKTSGPSFKIGEFLKSHRVTKIMKPFMGGYTPYDLWQVRRTGSSE